MPNGRNWLPCCRMTSPGAIPGLPTCVRWSTVRLRRIRAARRHFLVRLRRTGYAGRLVSWAWGTGGRLLTVVKRKPESHHFEVLPRRWVVKRTLAWLSRCRRLSKDYEELTESSEAWVHIAMVHLMLKRLQPV